MSITDTKVLRAYARYRKEHDDLPTIGQISKASGAGWNTAKKALSDAGLPWRHIRTKEREDMKKKRMATAEKLIQAHAELTEKLGRLPYQFELADAAGMSSGGYFGRFVYGLGLKFSRRGTVEREKQLDKEAARQPHDETPGFNQMRATPRMEKIFEIRRSGDSALRPEKLQRAGELYEMQDRIFITCPVCGARRLISPRMHPWWLRNAAGEAIFVCRDACTGRSL